LETRLGSIQYRSIASLRPNANNPRIHSKKQIRQIALSVKPFGFIAPILIDAEDRIIAGHGRVLAAQLLGMCEVPTIQIEHLSDHQITAFIVADNRLTENAEWDNRILGEQLKILSRSRDRFQLGGYGVRDERNRPLHRKHSAGKQRQVRPRGCDP